MISWETGKQEALLRQGDGLWTELCEVLDAADPAVALHDLEAPAWTSRDVYTHFWRMHSGSARAIRWEIAHGERYQWSGVDEDELNERHVAEDRSRGLAEARAMAVESRADYRALMASLRPDQFETAGRRHADDLVGGHYAGHLRYIRGIDG